MNVEKEDQWVNVGKEVKGVSLDLMDLKEILVLLAHLDSKENKVFREFQVLLDLSDHLDLPDTLEKMGFLVSQEKEVKLVKLEHPVNLDKLGLWDHLVNLVMLVHPEKSDLLVI